MDKLDTLPQVGQAQAGTGAGQAGTGISRAGAVQIGRVARRPRIADGEPHLPSLKSQGVNSSTFPFFLVHNAVEYVGTASNCCVLGYHSAFNPSGGVQTYGIGDYDNSGTFGAAFQDVTAMSHEVAEWQNDPSGVNPTPAWGHTGQVTNCQKNLEVGDPLTGNVYNVNLNGFTYHPQELAFFSWFYHQTPSLGVNGWYSDQGTFKTPAKACS